MSSLPFMVRKEHTLDSFLEAVGRKRFEDENGIITQSVTRALRDGKMPSHWFKQVRDWCVRNNLDVPEHLFKWSHLNSKDIKQNVNGEAGLQVLGSMTDTGA